MRKQLTAEQIQARDERRAAARRVAKLVSAMGDAERVHLAAKYGIRTIEGRELSLHNQCMIAIQFPSVTVGLSLRIEGEIAEVGVIVRIFARLANGEDDLSGSRRHARRGDRSLSEHYIE